MKRCCRCEKRQDAGTALVMLGESDISLLLKWRRPVWHGFHLVTSPPISRGEFVLVSEAVSENLNALPESRCARYGIFSGGCMMCTDVLILAGESVNVCGRFHRIPSQTVPACCREQEFPAECALNELVTERSRKHLYHYPKYLVRSCSRRYCRSCRTEQPSGSSGQDGCHGRTLREKYGSRRCMAFTDA